MAWLAAASIALCAWVPIASASCPDPAGSQRVPLKEEMTDTVAVIVAEVLGRRELHENASDPKAVTAQIVRVRVVQLVSGEIPDAIDIRQDAAGGGYVPGRQYLLFVQRRGPNWPLPLGDAYYVNDCGNSGPVAERTEVLREFGIFAGSDPRAQLAKALQAWSGSDALMHFRFILVDLNDDGVPDALALLTGAEYCGPGGCRLMVLQGEHDGSFRVVSSSTVTREPIALVARRSKGWHSLIVSIAGGGVAACKVRMDFDGQRYPDNPTLAPCVTDDELRAAAPLTLAP